MAKNYMAVAPDGEIVMLDPPEHHLLAVFGYMRLRKLLPKENPDNPLEEPRYDRFKRWVLIGTVENQKWADRLIGSQQYRGVTEETSVVHIVEAFDDDFAGPCLQPGGRKAGAGRSEGLPARDGLLPAPAPQGVQPHDDPHEAPGAEVPGAGQEG